MASDLQPFGGMDAFRLQYSARWNLFRLLIFNSRPTGINSFEEFSWTRPRPHKSKHFWTHTILYPGYLTRTLKSNLVSTVFGLFGQMVVDLVINFATMDSSNVGTIYVPIHQLPTDFTQLPADQRARGLWVGDCLKGGFKRWEWFQWYRADLRPIHITEYVV